MTEQLNTIDRREAIRRVTALLGGTALVGSGALFAACAKDRASARAGVGAFTADDVALLDEIAETILPATGTPGAKAAACGPFMALMVTDTYEEKDQQVFRQGLLTLDAASRTANGASFLDAAPAARLALLESLDREARAYQDTKQKDAPSHYFRMLKELALLGYFTSEIGCTQAQRYAETPGVFEPCVPYAPGERSWAGHA